MGIPTISDETPQRQNVSPDSSQNQHVGSQISTASAAPSSIQSQSDPSAAISRPPMSAQSESTVSSLPPEALDLASKLFDLARAGTTSTLSQYLQAGIPPNLTNSNGDTLLMLAAYHGHVPTVQMLLEARADPNVLNARGQSPIAGATFKGYDEVVAILFRGGADKDLGRPSALETANMFRRQGVLEMFGSNAAVEG